jgi:glycosyltransferase involved in cell wall biosynthesis
MSVSDMTDISIVIPFYNESESIQLLLQSITEYAKNKAFDFEIILVDDGSTDDTIRKIFEYGKPEFPSKLIKLSKNCGSHAAIRAGFLHANGKHATYLPADLQISFEAIEQLYKVANTGINVVFGTREENQVGVFEKMFSRAYANMMRKFVTKNFPYDGIETVLIDKKVLQAFNSNIESNSSFALQIMSMGFKTKFVHVNRTSRKAGKSKWTIGKKIKILIDSFVAFSQAPIRLVSVTGILFFITGIVWSAYLILRKLVFNDLASGWPELLAILLVGFGITNISLGIIAEYLWRTLDTSRNRPVFIVDEIIELNRNDKQ